MDEPHRDNGNSANDSLMTVYIRFTHLDISVFADLLDRIYKMHQTIVGVFNNTYTFPELFKDGLRNILHIENITTGNSITMKIREGWAPAFQPDSDDFLLDIPKSLGVPAIIASLLVSTINKAIVSSGNFLEETKKALEKEISENKDCTTIFNLLQQGKVKEALDKQALSMVHAAKSVEALRSVSVNGVNILSFDVNRRKYRRFFINFPVQIAAKDVSMNATVLNISKGGCVLKLSETKEIRSDQDFTLHITGHKLKPSQVSIWRDGDRSFMRAIFNPPIEESQFQDIVNC
jgi:hypothetical protein